MEVLKQIALPIAHVVTLVCCANDKIMCLKNRRDVARAIVLVCFSHKALRTTVVVFNFI